LAARSSPANHTASSSFLAPLSIGAERNLTGFNLSRAAVALAGELPRPRHGGSGAPGMSLVNGGVFAGSSFVSILHQKKVSLCHQSRRIRVFMIQWLGPRSLDCWACWDRGHHGGGRRRSKRDRNLFASRRECIEPFVGADFFDSARSSLASAK
jgi:hypothetical protein